MCIASEVDYIVLCESITLFVDQHEMAKRRLLNIMAIRLSQPLNIAFTTTRVCSSKRGMVDLRSPSKPRVFPSSGWDPIDPSLPIEEESIPSYRAEKFYPVRIAETLNHRYQIVGKLGYGSSATVWLCRDLL